MGSALHALVQLLTYSRKNFFRSRNWPIAKAGRTTLASVGTPTRRPISRSKSIGRRSGFSALRPILNGQTLWANRRVTHGHLELHRLNSGAPAFGGGQPSKPTVRTNSVNLQAWRDGIGSALNAKLDPKCCQRRPRRKVDKSDWR